MAKETSHQDIVNYPDFIFNHQFNRKLAIGKYFFTFRTIVFLGAAIIVWWMNPGNKQAQYLSLFLVYIVARGFKTTKLNYASKIRKITKDGHSDEKDGAILLYSKYTWSKKRIKNALKNK